MTRSKARGICSGIAIRKKKGSIPFGRKMEAIRRSYRIPKKSRAVARHFMKIREMLEVRTCRKMTKLMKNRGRERLSSRSVKCSVAPRDVPARGERW